MISFADRLRWRSPCFRPCRCRSSTGTKKTCGTRMCAFPLIGVVIGALWCLCGVLPLPDAARAAGVLPDAGLGHRRHPSGRLRRHLRRTFELRRPGKEAGDLKGPPLRGLRRHPAVQLLCGLSGPVRLCTVHPAGRAALDDGTGAGTGALRAMRWRRSPWQRTPALPTPLPRRPTEPLYAECWPCSGRCTVLRPCWHWAAGRWCWPHWLCCGGTTPLPASSSAASPVIWPGGFCRKPRSGCWRRCAACQWLEVL